MEFSSCYLATNIRFFAVRYNCSGSFIYFTVRIFRNIASSAKEVVIIDTEDSNTTAFYNLIEIIKAKVDDGSPHRSLLLGKTKLWVWRAAMCKKEEKESKIEGEEEGEISTLLDIGIVDK